MQLTNETRGSESAGIVILFIVKLPVHVHFVVLWGCRCFVLFCSVLLVMCALDPDGGGGGGLLLIVVS